jgi:hypothetical protein
MPDQLALRFERERETKNTIRYQELAEEASTWSARCTCAKPSWRG